MPIYFVMFEGTPRQGRAEDGVGGAMINCWLRRDDLELAIADARAGIVEAGWIVDDPDEAHEVGLEDYEPDAPGRDYYRQAETEADGAVFVFHQYPDINDDED